MPILPLFNTNNTFQWLNRVVKGGRKEAGRRKEQTRTEKLHREAKIAEGNEGFSHPSSGQIMVRKRFIWLFQIHHNVSFIPSSFLNISENNNLSQQNMLI